MTVAVLDAVRQANGSILAAGVGEREGMGTTIVDRARPVHSAVVMTSHHDIRRATVKMDCPNGGRQRRSQRRVTGTTSRS